MARELLLLTSLLLLAGCVHLSDADVRKSLPGAWHWVLPPLDEYGNGMELNFTIATNGDFTRQILMITNGVPFVDGVDMAGRLQIQDGYLIQTVTYMRVRRNAVLPLILRAKIIHADDSEVLVVFDGMTEQDLLRKDTR